MAYRQCEFAFVTVQSGICLQFLFLVRSVRRSVAFIMSFYAIQRLPGGLG